MRKCNVQACADIRSAYIAGGVSLQEVAARFAITPVTARRWQNEALAQGDDWEKLREAKLMAGNDIEAVARGILEDCIIQHKQVTAEIAGDAGLTAEQKVTLLTRLAGSFSKTVQASRRVLPETSELATALEVMNLFAAYIKNNHSQQISTFVEVLDGFGPELSRHFSKKR